MFGSLKTITRRAARSALSASLATAAGLALIAVPAAPAQAAQTCLSPCFSQVAPHVDSPNDAGVSFTTSTRATAILYVSQGGRVVQTYTDPNLAFTHDLRVPYESLTPHTAYTWQVRATDNVGQSNTVNGAFTTLSRKVDVLFTTIDILDDSDPTGSGELRGWNRVGDQVRQDNQLPEELNSGDTALFTDHFTALNVGFALTVRTEVKDSDLNNPFLPTSSLPYGNPDWTSGSNLQYDWATAVVTLDVDSASNHLRPFQSQVRGKFGSIQFVVHGYYSVSYY